MTVNQDRLESLKEMIEEVNHIEVREALKGKLYFFASCGNSYYRGFDINKLGKEEALKKSIEAKKGLINVAGAVLNITFGDGFDSEVSNFSL